MVDVRSALLLELTRGEGSGAELIRRISERTGGALSPAEGSVYPAIQSLRSEALIACREAPPTSRGGRPALICMLTAPGRREADIVRRALLALSGDST